MKKITKYLSAFLAAVLIAGMLSGCGAIGPMLIHLNNVVADANEKIENQDTDPAEDFIADLITEEDTALQETETGQIVETQTFEETQTADDAGMEETTAAEETEEPSVQNTDSLISSELLPEYEHYDPTQFYKDCESMEELLEKGSQKEAFALYEKLYAELLKVMDLYTVADLNAYADTTNDTLDREKEYSHDLTVDMSDAFCASCKTMITGKEAAAFKDYLDDDYLEEYYETYDVMTDELKALYSRETELENDYFDVMDGLKDITCTYKGKEYRFGDVIDNGNSLYASDQDTYYAVFENCYKQLNEQAGKIFLELVQLRDKIAKLNGYDNYNAYADTELYGREYSESAMEKMKAAARKFGGEYQGYYYYAYQSLPEYNADTKQLLADCKDCITGISPLADKSFLYLEDNGLYSIGPENERADVGFTTSLYEKNIPFIFIKTSGNANDLITLTHEFGHFTDAYYNANPYPICTSGQYDIFEIHSTGLQLLAGEKYEKIFGEDANMVNAFNVLSLMTYITDGCIYDEWQRQVYENPDMTLDEINSLFKKVSAEYGVTEYTGSEYSWVEVSHNFTSPLYYFSYAASAFASLQILQESLNDYSNAVSMWEKVISEGAYDKDYMNVLKDAGLKTFDNTQTVYNLLSDSFRYAQTLLLGGGYSW